MRISQPASPAQPRQPADFRVKFSSSRPGPGPSQPSPAQPSPASSRRVKVEPGAGRRHQLPHPAQPPAPPGTCYITQAALAAVWPIWPGYGHYGHQMTDGHTPHSILTPADTLINYRASSQTDSRNPDLRETLSGLVFLHTLNHSTLNNFLNDFLSPGPRPPAAAIHAPLIRTQT